MPENINGSTPPNENYEFASFYSHYLNPVSGKDWEGQLLFGIRHFFDKDFVERVIRNPIFYRDEAIKLSELIYNKNGMISNSIDFMTHMMTLDRVIIADKDTEKVRKNKALMKSALKVVKDKKFLRDALFSEMLMGCAVYYFDTTNRTDSNKKFLHDFDVQGITEINELGINASIITLPYKYVKIIGKKNGRYVLAFDLTYFNQWYGEELNRKLKKYPKEIVDGYQKMIKGLANGNWMVLDNDKTMCCKIKAKDSESWGRSLIISAIIDVLYKDYFVDTKRNTLDEINNKVIYEVFPENKEKNGSTLTQKQQQAQHNVVKDAINNKNNRGGTTFVSLAAGTKLDAINVSTDIFDNDNESSLNADIATDLGICASLIGAMESGSYAAGQNNLEMITSRLYSWICEWKDELVHVINANIIKDNKNKVDIYYLPTSFVNKKEFFDMMKTLYSEASGSLTFLIAASGVDPDAYLAVCDQEIKDGYFEKYQPHQTAYTQSSKNEGGRPTTDNPSENTVRSQEQLGNELPSPSDN